MADVARRAGVSVSTVSYVLSGVRPISPQTTARIHEAMAELRYTPNVLARGLKSKRSRVIALILPGSKHEPRTSYLEYVLAVSDQVQARGYHLMLWTNDPGSLTALRTLASQGLVEGVLVVGAQLTSVEWTTIREAGLAAAAIGTTGVDLDLVDGDFEHCADLVLQHLAGLGHQRLGLITRATAGRQRQSQHTRFRRHVIKAAAELGCSLTPVASDASFTAGRQAVVQLLGIDPCLTAVICFNDKAVGGVLTGLGAAGRRVPQDVSVISVGLPSHLAAMFGPPLTTAGPPPAQMSRSIVDLLIRRMEGAADGIRTELFKSVLVERETTTVAPSSPSS